jgi:hypothetical protein
MLFPSIFFFSSKKKHKEKKSIEKKRNAKKGGSLLSSFRSTLSLLAFASGLLFLPFCFKCSLASSSFQVEEKNNTKKKITIEKKKMQRREGSYLSSFASAFGMKHSSCFLLSTFLQH